MYAHIYTHIHTYTHIYTHIHTYTYSGPQTDPYKNNIHVAMGNLFGSDRQARVGLCAERCTEAVEKAES